MIIKIIHEDDEIQDLKEKIKMLDSKQIYFLENFIRKEKIRKKTKVFEEWLKTLDNIIINHT